MQKKTQQAMNDTAVPMKRVRSITIPRIKSIIRNIMAEKIDLNDEAAVQELFQENDIYLSSGRDTEIFRKGE